MNHSVITDMQRCDFLWKIHRSGLVLSEWEDRFVLSFRQTSQPSFWFTQARRASVDRMRQKYGHEPEINMPFSAPESAPAKASDADPDGCEYYVREEGRLRRCNERAEWMRQSGFRYCQAHADAVQKALKRRGQTMHLEIFRLERGLDTVS
jgi:hypothetical protein